MQLLISLWNATMPLSVLYDLNDHSDLFAEPYVPESLDQAKDAIECLQYGRQVDWVYARIGRVFVYNVLPFATFFLVLCVASWLENSRSPADVADQPGIHPTETRNPMTTDVQNNDCLTFDQWCLVEIMGHQRYAGRVTEQTLGGRSFVRVDIPAVGDQPEFTKLFGADSVFSITPMAEQLVRSLAAEIRAAPVSVYDLPEEIRAKLRASSQQRLNYEESEEGPF